jgi:hypothetical protein
LKEEGFRESPGKYIAFEAKLEPDTSIRQINCSYDDDCCSL